MAKPVLLVVVACAALLVATIVLKPRRWIRTVIILSILTILSIQVAQYVQEWEWRRLKSSMYARRVLVAVLWKYGYAGIFWIVCDANFLAHPYEGIVNATVGAIFGLPIGFACSSFMILWLSRKSLVSAGLILLLVVSPTVPLSILGLDVIGVESVLAVTCLVVFGFVVCCKAVSIYLPDIVFEHPKCRGCGYDLTGNQSGVCPECGLTLDSLMLEGLE